MTDPCKGCITAWERGGKQSFIGLSLCFGSGCLLEGQEFLLVYAFVLEKASPKINAGKGLHPYLHWGPVKRTCSIQPGLLLLLGSQTMMTETFLMPDLHACWVPLLRSSNYKSTKKGNIWIQLWCLQGHFPSAGPVLLPKVLLKMEVALLGMLWRVTLRVPLRVALLGMYEAAHSSSNVVPACLLEQYSALNAKACFPGITDTCASVTCACCRGSWALLWFFICSVLENSF